MSISVKVVRRAILKHAYRYLHTNTNTNNTQHTQGGPSSERAIESSLKVPPLVAQAMEAYAQRYTTLKAPRKLHWKPHVGCVEMQVCVVFTCVVRVFWSRSLTHSNSLTAYTNGVLFHNYVLSPLTTDHSG